MMDGQSVGLEWDPGTNFQATRQWNTIPRDGTGGSAIASVRLDAIIVGVRKKDQKKRLSNLSARLER